jgi:hypothetical protein
VEEAYLQQDPIFLLQELHYVESSDQHFSYPHAPKIKISTYSTRKKKLSPTRDPFFWFTYQSDLKVENWSEIQIFKTRWYSSTMGLD